MILQSLVQLYENLLYKDNKNEIPKLGWCTAKVSHAIDLNTDGTIKTIKSLNVEKTVRNGTKTIWESASLNVPEMVIRTSKPAANFLCDNAKYFLGLDSDGSSEKSIECFETAKEKHLEILKDAKGTMARAVYLYFENWNPKTAAEHLMVKEHLEELAAGGNLIFCMKDKDAQDDEEIRELWEKQLELEDNEQNGICLVTGEKTAIARIHRGIRGIPGAQSSGAALVSFNAPAFESYGKEQSYNGPVGKYAEFAYTTALNYLLNQKYRFLFADSMILFWADSAEEQYQKIFFSLMNPSDDQESSFSFTDLRDNQETLQKVFGNLKQGIRVDLDDISLDLNQNFYILCLAPNAARLSVRFFYQNSFGTILNNLANHYKRMEIVKPSWGNLEYLGIHEMLNETVNKKSKDKTPIPNMASLVLYAVLQDANYPASLYTDTLMRIRAEQGTITYGRAAIIKAFLIKNYNWKEGEDYMGLNETCQEPAYILGRIFAVLESIQRDVNPEINVTIRDRYFNSACTTPASVFPILFKLKNSHIKKLEREFMGKKLYYEKMLTELMGKLSISETIEGFPKRISLEEQGKFMLGYYHQIQKKYEKKEEK